MGRERGYRFQQAQQTESIPQCILLRHQFFTKALNIVNPAKPKEEARDPEEAYKLSKPIDPRSFCSHLRFTPIPHRGEGLLRSSSMCWHLSPSLRDHQRVRVRVKPIRG